MLLTRVSFIEQLGKWFEKARQHKKKSTADKPEDEDMLLFEPEENISVRRNVEDIDEDEISQPATYPPSFTSQLSVASTSSTVSSSHPPKCSLHANTDESQHSHPTLSISAANKLSFFAIRFLITGCKTQPKRDMQGITIEKPLPDPGKSLSRIAPSLFSPGFKEIMGINANFLQTISHAISTSWVRNVQSPSLRKKLEALANLTTSQYPDRNQESAEEQGSSQRLAAVVQAKLWGVMQRKLYDPTAVRKLRHQTLPERVGGVVDEEDCEDLLGDGVAEENGIDFEDMSCRDFMDEEVVEEFDDLLAGQDADHDEDLLHYFEGQAAAERERLEVKIKTDEMLFGSECDSESEDGILLLDSETERMLL
jgi:hypothetical protein